VFQLGGLPKDRPGPDGGIDGIIRYHRVGLEQPNRAVVSVKGGLHVGVDAVHKLKSVMQREGAEVGVLVCINPPTSAMQKEAASAGEIGPRSRRVAKIQIVSVDMLFDRHPIDLPGILDQPEVKPDPISPQPKKGRKRVEGQAEMLFAMDVDQKDYVADDKKSSPRTKRSTRTIDIEVTRPRASKHSK
jgi:hypothetical protein